MKTLKVVLVMLAFLAIPFQNTNAQDDKFQAFSIHEDKVKPSKIAKYEKAAKAFNEMCNTYKPDTNWSAASTVNGSYFYITPIENMAELDSRPFASLFEKAGDKATKLFEEMDTCYDSHGNYIVLLNKDLTYMPDGLTIDTSDQNYRKWHFIYVSPENKAEMTKKMKAVKDLFVAKNSKMHYRVYQNGFGQMDNYFLVVISAKDQLDFAQKAQANRELLGPDSKATFDAVFNLCDKYEETTGRMRPDLAYSSKE